MLKLIGMKIKHRKVKIVVVMIVLLLIIGIMNIQSKIVKVLVYDYDKSDYVEKLFYCRNNTKDAINNLQKEIKISHSQTRKCRKIATANGRLCVQERCRIISDMEFCVNACSNRAFIEAHCVEKDDQLDALRKELYTTVQKNCND